MTKRSIQFWSFILAVSIYPIRLSIQPTFSELRILSTGEIWILTPLSCLVLRWQGRGRPSAPVNYDCAHIKYEELKTVSEQQDSEESHPEPIPIQYLRTSTQKRVHLFFPQWKILILRNPRRDEFKDLQRRVSPHGRLIVISKRPIKTSTIPAGILAKMLIVNDKSPLLRSGNWPELRFELRQIQSESPDNSRSISETINLRASQ